MGYDIFAKHCYHHFFRDTPSPRVSIKKGEIWLYELLSRFVFHQDDDAEMITVLLFME